MYALLAYKRPSLTEGRFQLAFEIRNFGCFNGFNTENAFTVSPQHNGQISFDVVFDDVMENGGLPPGYWYGGRTDAERLSSHDRRALYDFSRVAVRGAPNQATLQSIHDDGLPWQCLGIGYLCYQVAQCNLTYQEPSVRGANGFYVVPTQLGGFQPANAYHMNSRVTALLNRNRINGTYYNHYSGDTMTSRRKFTPNEQFLSNFLFSMDQAPADIKCSLKSSRVILAIKYATDYQHMTFDLVGSERPSGLAISYLQAFRNIAEKQWNGMGNSTLADQSSLTCLAALAENWPYATLDPIPLMSFLCNNGDDSDIIAFAGREFVMYATKFGLFECDHLYRRKDSMLIEGRYNKGGQSVYIHDAVRAKITAKNVGESYVEALNAIGVLSDWQANLNRKPDITGFALSMQASLPSLPADPTLRQQGIARKAAEYAMQIQNWLEASGSFEAKVVIANVRRAASALTSFRTTRKSNITLAPDPLAFTAWVRQAEGISRTAEGSAPEEPAAVPVGAQPVNAGGGLEQLWQDIA